MIIKQHHDTVPSALLCCSCQGRVGYLGPELSPQPMGPDTYNPSQTLPEGLSKGESSQSPAEEDVGTVQLPHKPLQGGISKIFLEKPDCWTQASHRAQHSERTPPQNTSHKSRQVSCSPHQHMTGPRLARSIHRGQKSRYSCTV